MLTTKQRELLLFINDRIEVDGVSPSFDEMKDALNLASKSGIHRLITALEERGFLRRLPHRARALEVLKLPPNPHRRAGSGALADAAGSDAAPSGNPRGDFAAANTGAAGMEESQAAFDVPVLGQIAAGTPISAIQHEVDRMPVPASMVGLGDHFALRVKGDSMVDAGILDGDTVLIQRRETAENGDIVVALVDEEEATLKRLYRHGGTVALEAENPAYETRQLPASRVRVQGRLVGLVRSYH